MNGSEESPALAGSPQATLLARMQAALLHSWLTLQSSRAARNSAYMMCGQVSIVFLQALQFLLLARALGSEEFGRIASVVAITSALLPYSGLGLGNVSVMRIARNQARPDVCLGNALCVTAISGVVGVGLALLIGTTLLHDPNVWTLMLLLGTSEILLTKCIDVAAHVFFGLEKHRISTLFYNLHMLVRVACAAALYFAWSRPTALVWAQLHLAAGLVTAAAVLFTTIRLLGRPRIDFRSAMRDARTGIFFSVTVSARSVQTDADKSVLARSASAGTAGVYTAAFRLAYMLCMPISAILIALQARTFRKGHVGGLAGTLRALRPLVIAGGFYCVAVAGLMYLAAPAVPWLLGNSYRPSSDILRWLCLVPFLWVFQAICSAALSGANQQPRLGLLHSATAGTSLLLNLALVPMYGWRGAVMAAYGSQAFLLLSVLVTIARQLRSQRKATR